MDTVCGKAVVVASCVVAGRARTQVLLCLLVSLLIFFAGFFPASSHAADDVTTTSGDQLSVVPATNSSDATIVDISVFCEGPAQLRRRPVALLEGVVDVIGGIQQELFGIRDDQRGR